MNEVFNLGVTYYQLLGLIVAIIIGTIAIRITFRFDLNRFLEKNQETNRQKLKNACPHLEIIFNNEQIAFKSFFVSPPGTMQWQCQRCGLTTYISEDEIKEMAEYYVKNPEKYKQKNKKFLKLLKKSGQI